jgi:hypothetical protein
LLERLLLLWRIYPVQGNLVLMLAPVEDRDGVAISGRDDAACD